MGLVKNFNTTRESEFESKRLQEELYEKIQEICSTYADRQPQNKFFNVLPREPYASRKNIYLEIHGGFDVEEIDQFYKEVSEWVRSVREDLNDS